MRRAPVAVLLVLAAGWASAAAGGPEAQVIAFDRGGAVWTIRADGTGARKLIPQAYAPAWSPDGSRVAFVSARSGDEELYAANADGSGVRRLTRRSGPDLTPAWSPDGRRIAFHRVGDGIWVMNADGSGLTRLTAGADPSWRP